MKSRMAWRVLVVVTATTCACASKPTVAPSDAGKGSGSDSGNKPHDAATAVNTGHCSGMVQMKGTAAAAAPSPPALTLSPGFSIEVIATVDSARQLVALPNGDLLVSTRGTDVWIVPNAEATASPDAPILFTSVNDAPVQGIAFLPDTCTLAVGSQHGIYTTAYADGQTTATLGSSVAAIRSGALVHTSTDTDTHITTSLTFADGKLYAGVGSSCNACVEVDPTRATVQEMAPDGSGMTTRARRIRNAIAVTTNPATGTVWAGGAGQDDLAEGHPYEFFDAVTLHTGEADYGWPACEEHQTAYIAGADCSGTVVPRIELPAYSTLIGAAFYPVGQTGAYAFPKAYRGGLFITAHGSWHTISGSKTYFSAPRVAFIAMNGDTPKIPVDWADPTKQWVDFMSGFQLADGTTRIGRPTGVAVGVKGSLFVADDQTNEVYRVRPD